MSGPTFPLDWKESPRPRSFLGHLWQLVSFRRRRTQYFLDPELPASRFAYAAQRTSPYRTLARRGLLLIVLVCGAIYGGVWAERWHTERRHSQWLEASQASLTEPAVVGTSSTADLDADGPQADPLLSTTPATPDAATATRAPEGSQTTGATRPDGSDLAIGDPIGRLRIPELGVDGFVEHGETETVLRRAIGHLPGTPLPGQGGNVVVAGHRDSFFRGLRRAAQGDVIEFETPYGTHRYEVDGLRIVGPNDAEVLAGTDDERLTLVTCYPFDYVGPAPRRFIVTARSLPAS